MNSARLWFARIVTLYAALIFLFLAYLFVIEPLEHIARFGIIASGVPESINFLRTGPGALFAAMAITAIYGLAKPDRLLTCLWIIVLFNGCIVVVRLFGIAVDGITPLQLTELRDEGISWLVFVAALVAHPR
jgi:hypothetical protein